MSQITPSYEHSVTMKKVNVNGSIYWVKDNDLRALVESFHDAVFKDVSTTFTEDGVALATEAATAAWVKDKIKDLEGAMHFRGVVPRIEGKTDRECIDAFYTDKSMVPAQGDIVIMQDNGKEYLCTANSAKTVAGATWEEIGDQNIYLTKAEAATTYTPMTRTIAGIDLQDDITVTELSSTAALDLKALAHKASAEGSVTTVDTINDITVAKSGSYTLAGDTVAVPASYSALDVTPAGDVAISAGTAAAATYQKTSSVTIAAAAPSGEATANYTPAGSIALPTLTASVTLSPTDVATVTDAGTAYTLTDGSVVKGDDTKASFIKKGVSIGINKDDAEQLDIAYVTDTTSTEFFASAVTAAGGITYTKQTISGALPTFGTQSVALTTGASASAAYSGDATFSGTGVVLGATPAFETANATVTQPTFTAAFTGTSKTVTPAVATTTDAQAPSGTITVGTETKSITFNSSSKTVTVS